MHIRGDWKFMKQAFSLVRHYGCEKICHQCEATRGKADPSKNFTNLASTSSWQASLDDPSVPWNRADPPSLSGLRHFCLDKLSLDVLHVWHLGVARDVCLVCAGCGPCIFSMRS